MSLYSALIPGIQKLITQAGASFKYDGLIPAVILGDSMRQIDMWYLVRLAEKDKYAEIEKYIQEICK